MITTFALGAGFALAVAGSALATHPRPGGGTPFRVPLVEAFDQCITPNSSHVAPLSLPSCSPPNPAGQITTTGTTGTGQGALTLRVLCTDGKTPPCAGDGVDTEDVRVTVSQTDVRCTAGGAPGCTAAGMDYTGKFIVTSQARITDHANGSPPSVCTNGAGLPPCVTATVQDLAYSLPGQCVDNGGPNGGACSLVTTFDTMVPGTVKEFQRASWQLPGELSGQSLVGWQLSDAGPDGSVDPAPTGCPPTCGTGDEDPLSRQGLFVP